MTARDVFEATLTELSKVNAPSLLLHEFNYYFNKAIRQYTNKRYNIYDVSQLTTDDLRVLKSEAKISITSDNRMDDDVFGATYLIILPDDYLHLLNCICVFELKKNNRCYNKGDKIPFSAKRLTGDSWSVVMNDYYNRPLPERPYYYIHNVNDSFNELTPTNTLTDLVRPYNVGPTKVTTTVKYWYNKNQVEVKNGKVFDLEGNELPNVEIENLKTETTTIEEKGESNDSNFPRVINLNSNFTGKSIADTVNREAGQRYGNASKVRCEIRYGYDTTVFDLILVRIDYIKAPQNIRLTLEQVNLTEDTSQIMEFPDYVCLEIINELILLVMQRDNDPRLQTLTAVTQSIANPAQQLTQQSQPQLRG